MNMILLDCYCAFTLQNVALAFFMSFGFACKQQLIGNAFVFSVLLSSCIPFLCHFACSPSFSLFHFYSFFLHKWPISVLQWGVFLGQKGCGQKNLLGAKSPDPILPFPRGHDPEIFPARTAPVGGQCSKFLIRMCTRKGSLGYHFTSTPLASYQAPQPKSNEYINVVNKTCL